MRIHLVIIGFLITLICWWVLAHTQLHFCLTSSLDGAQIILFYKTPAREIKRGNIVYIRGHDYKYLGPQPYAKRVIGLSGDPIIRDNNTIRVGTRNLQLIDKTSEGQPLTPIVHDTVPQGYFFVAGDHPRSIDSRYVEFGLVPVGKVWGKGVAKW
jgi:conjugal transfer pilin signal peptidase TrbI